MPRTPWLCAALAAVRGAAVALPPLTGKHREPLAVGQASHEQVLSGMSYEDLPMEASAGFARNCASPSQMTRVIDGDADGDDNSSMPPSGPPAKLFEWPLPSYWMNQLKDTFWMDIRPKPYVSRKPKMALLMFTKDKVYNEHVWASWLDRARKDNISFAMHIHAYGVEDPEDWQSKRLKRYLVKEKAYSTWCNMWRPQMLLMKKAFEDPDVSHVMMVSQDSIPVKSMKYIYSQLRADPVTRMCGDDKWRREWPRAESWWLMRREDALLFTEHEGFAHNHFLSHCTEEQAWYYPLRMREERWGNRTQVRNECPMFTNWMDGPKACKVWRWNVNLCPGCDALRGSPQEPAGFMHPVAYHRVNYTALKGLWDSPFWFARKFEDMAVEEEAAMLLHAAPSHKKKVPPPSPA